jgi:toxin HigB-1
MGALPDVVVRYCVVPPTDADTPRVARSWISSLTRYLIIRILMLYTIRVISSFRHKGVERFFKTGSKAGIQPKHADRLRVQLFALNNAKKASDMKAPGWRLHPLHGELTGYWAIEVSGNWRLTFAFEGQDAVLVDYQDYH